MQHHVEVSTVVVCRLSQFLVLKLEFRFSFSRSIRAFSCSVRAPVRYLMFAVFCFMVAWSRLLSSRSSFKSADTSSILFSIWHIWCFDLGLSQAFRTHVSFAHAYYFTNWQ